MAHAARLARSRPKTPQVAARIRMLREHGQAQKYYHDLEGYNGRLDAIQAAFLRIKLRHLDGWNQQRRQVAATYRDLLSSVPELVLPFEPESSKAVYHLYVIAHHDREALAAQLKSDGVFTGLHYPLPVHRQQCYRGWGYRPGSLPITERLADTILSLPMFPGLSDDQQRRVAEAVGAFCAVPPTRRIDRSDGNHWKKE